MSKYDTFENVCSALTIFIKEIREQAAAIKAYHNVFQDKTNDNVFLSRAYDSIWRDLLSEIARIFDKACTGSSENCTLLRLRNLCLKEPYSVLFPNGERDPLIQSLDEVFEKYNQLPISYSRKKQLAHHDLEQVIAGSRVEVSFEQVEKLIAYTTDAFVQIYTHFSSIIGKGELSFPEYKTLVRCFERDINRIVP